MLGGNPDVGIVGELGEVLAAQDQHTAVVASDQSRYDLLALAILTAHSHLL
jgi:hypothetical protein